MVRGATHFAIVGGGGPCGWVWGRGSFEGKALSQAADGGAAGWGAFDLYCRRSCRSILRRLWANDPDGKAERPAADMYSECRHVLYSRVHHSLCWVAEQGSIRPIVLGCAVVRNTRRGLGCCVSPFVCYMLQSCLTAVFPSPSDPVPDGKVEKSSINHN